MLAESKCKDKILIAVDVDHTLVDGNTDYELVNRYAKDGLPEEITRLRTISGPIAYKNGVYQLLHGSGVTADDIKSVITGIPIVKGMPELFSHVKANKERYELVIVSDANTQFVQWILEHHGFLDLPTVIFSNPAEISDGGCLKLRGYHQQIKCDLSPANLCKGEVLDEYIQRKACFKQINYVGDGRNDLCPSLRIPHKNNVFAREGFRLQEMIKESGNIKANVVIWSDASDIIVHLG